MNQSGDAMEVFFTADDERVERNGGALSFGVWSPVAGGRSTRSFDLSPLPFCEAAMRWIEERAENVVAATLETYCGYLQRYGEYATVCGDLQADLTPETYRAFVRWLKQERAEDGSARFSLLEVYATVVKVRSVYAHGARTGYAGWDERNLDLMGACVAAECRGHHEEARHRSINGAFSGYEYENLIRAAGAEIEECRRVLEVRALWEARDFTAKPVKPNGGKGARERFLAYFRGMLQWFAENQLPVDIYRFCKESGSPETTVRRYPEIWEQISGWPERWVLAANREIPLGRQGFLDPNPYAAFAVLVGLRNGVRAEELNVIDVADVDVERGYLFLHAPNKEYDEEHQSDVKIEDAVVEAFEMVTAWSAAARAIAQDPSPLMLFLARSSDGFGSSRPTFGAVQATTQVLNRNWLPRLYRKYFDRRVVEDGSERPLLHCEGDPERPFSAPYRKYRNAAIRNYLEQERNLVHVQRFARHKSIRTTGTSYAHAHQADNDHAVAMALGPTARVYQIALKNGVVVEVDDEVRRREALGGATPFGTCGDPALDGVTPEVLADRSGSGCSVRKDCLDCEHLYLHVEKRPILAAEVEALLAEANELAEQGFIRDAENLRGAASLRQAHVYRIDELMEAKK